MYIQPSKETYHSVRQHRYNWSMFSAVQSYTNIPTILFDSTDLWVIDFWCLDYYNLHFQKVWKTLLNHMEEADLPTQEQLIPGLGRKGKTCLPLAFATKTSTFYGLQKLDVITQWRRYIMVRKILISFFRQKSFCKMRMMIF